MSWTSIWIESVAHKLNVYLNRVGCRRRQVGNREVKWAGECAFGWVGVIKRWAASWIASVDAAWCSMRKYVEVCGSSWKAIWMTVDERGWTSEVNIRELNGLLTKPRLQNKLKGWGSLGPCTPLVSRPDRCNHWLLVKPRKTKEGYVLGPSSVAPLRPAVPN